jgi:hypothetical protein
MLRVDTTMTGLPGMPGYNSLFFTGMDDAPAAVAARNAVLDFWTDVAGYGVVNDVTFRIEPDVAIVDDETGDVTGYRTVDPGAYVSVVTEGALPTATQLCINLLTAGVVNSRRVRGRIFVPGLGVSTNTVDGQPAASLISYMGNQVQQLIDVGLVVWSRPREASAGPPPVTARAGSVHPVTGAQVKTEWSILRSRRD